MCLDGIVGNFNLSFSTNSGYAVLIECLKQVCAGLSHCTPGFLKSLLSSRNLVCICACVRACVCLCCVYVRVHACVYPPQDFSDVMWCEMNPI